MPELPAIAHANNFMIAGSKLPYIVNILIALVIAAATGLASAWYVMANGTAFTTASVGPWTILRQGGDPKADPYTLAIMARSGELPLSIRHGLFITAQTDSDDRSLVSSCDYAVTGKTMPASWWTLTAFDEAGRLVANYASRHSYNSTNVVRARNGSFEITLARHARPGNWIPTGEVSGLKLTLRIFGPDKIWSEAEDLGWLPEIRRLRCD